VNAICWVHPSPRYIYLIYLNSKSLRGHKKIEEQNYESEEINSEVSNQKYWKNSFSEIRTTEHTPCFFFLLLILIPSPSQFPVPTAWRLLSRWCFYTGSGGVNYGPLLFWRRRSRAPCVSHKRQPLALAILCTIAWLDLHTRSYFFWPTRFIPLSTFLDITALIREDLVLSSFC